jgi:hypothetical protein
MKEVYEYLEDNYIIKPGSIVSCGDRVYFEYREDGQWKDGWIYYERLDLS